MKALSAPSLFVLVLLFPRPLVAQQRDLYTTILPTMVEVACYRHKGVSDESIIDFVQGKMEVLRISPEQFRSTVTSGYWRANWVEDGAKILARKGGCEQIWQDWLNFHRALDQPKPSLREEDPSRPFSF